MVTLVETKKPAATPPHRQQGAPPPVAAGAQANTVQVSGLAVGGLDKVSMGSLVVLFEQHGNTQIPPPAKQSSGLEGWLRVQGR